MEIREKLELIINNLKNRLEEENIKMHMKTFTKNNNVKLEGMVFFKEGESMGPTIYIRDLERMLDDGISAESIEKKYYKEIKDLVEVPRIKFNFSSESILENAYISVVNGAANEAQMKDIVFEKIDDTDLIAMVRVRVEDGSYVLNRTMLQMTNQTKEEVLSAAWDNTINGEAVIKPLNQMISEIMDEPMPDVGIYVITNRDKTYGAVQAIGNRYVQDELFEKLGEYFIIPSSVHECLAISAKGNDYRELEVMCRMVNENEVAVEERLSNKIYHYNGRKLQLAENAAKIKQTETITKKHTIHF